MHLYLNSVHVPLSWVGIAVCLYKFKKLALGVVFGVGVLVGLILATLLCGGSKSNGNKKKTE